mmetsp:Transcript_14986/g.27181  ORF Transcript_14986/g.27181 Transcript_14986/m.27181 type:complete len:350 (-) Transcript_14986:178-1227(-)
MFVSSRVARTAATVWILSSLWTRTTYAYGIASTRRPAFARTRHISPAATSSLQATVFYPCDEDDELCSIFDEEVVLEEENHRYHLEGSLSIAEKLNVERMDALARLAVAFSPHPLELKDVERVHTIKIDDHHIEIEAVVCEDDGCITLFVPIEFPHACDLLSLGQDEECVLGNIMELDHEAEHLLEERNIQHQHDDDKTKEGQLLMDQIYSGIDHNHNPNNMVGVELPAWWIAPSSSSLVMGEECLLDECDSVKKLLNTEDFQGDVKALAQRGLELWDDEREFEVRSATVAAVGPAGVHLRTISDTFTLFQSPQHNQMVDVSIPFNSPATDVASLRAAILGTIAASHAY